MGALVGGALGTAPEWAEKIKALFPGEDPRDLEEMFAELPPDQQQFIRQILGGGEEPEEHAEGGPVGINLRDIPGLLPGPAAPTQLPAGGGRRYVGAPRTEEELANYGEGPAARYFENDPVNLNVDYTKTGTGIPGAQATQGGGNNALIGTLGSLPQIWKGIGMADKVLGTGLQGTLKGLGTKALGSLGLGGAGGAATTTTLAAPLAEIAAPNLVAATSMPAAGTLGGGGIGGTLSSIGSGISNLGSSIYGGLAAMGPVGWAGAAALAAGTAIAASQPKSSPLNHFKYDKNTGTGGWTKGENFDGMKFTPDELNSYYGPAMNEFIRNGGDDKAALALLGQPTNEREATMFKKAKHLFGGSGNPMRKVAMAKDYGKGLWTKGAKGKKALGKSYEEASRNA
jgi:hypothetical protein